MISAFNNLENMSRITINVLRTAVFWRILIIHMLYYEYED